MDCITSTQSFASLPATLATLRASWLFAPLERLGLRCLPPPDVERMLRRCTSVALKKATMKGCLFCGPLRPISPATRGLMLSPAGGDTEKSTTGAPHRDLHSIHAGRCIKRKGMLLKSNKCTSTCCACVYFAPPSLSLSVHSNTFSSVNSFPSFVSLVNLEMQRRNATLNIKDYLTCARVKVIVGVCACACMCTSAVFI